MILDAAFLIDLLDAGRGAIRRARNGGRRSRSENPRDGRPRLYVGVGKVARSEREEQRVRRVVDSLTVVEMDERIASRVGRLVGTLLRGDRTLGKGDAAIGATAIVEGEPVLTRNVDDFRRIPALDIETY